jgi:hypothetical protein
MKDDVRQRRQIDAENTVSGDLAGHSNGGELIRPPKEDVPWQKPILSELL